MYSLIYKERVTVSDFAEEVLPEDVEEESQAPLPEQQRTEDGYVKFSKLILPAAPPHFRPYAVLDEQEKVEKHRQMGKSGKKSSSRMSVTGA